MTQRAHVRSLLIESLKNAWTNGIVVVDDIVNIERDNVATAIVVDDGDVNLSNDDEQLMTMATSAIRTSYEDENDEEVENEQLHSSETKPNVSFSVCILHRIDLYSMLHILADRFN